MTTNKDDNITIYEILNKVQSNDLVVPALQRSFVWKKNQIIDLFDSIYREYPVGTFLFWKIEKEYINKYKDSFYCFLQDYSQYDKKDNEKASVETKENLIAVLDGQQRITSLLIGLRGYYEEHIKNKSWNDKESFRKTSLYFNILSNPKEIKEDSADTFNFYENIDAVNYNDEKHCWILLSDIMNFTPTNYIERIKEYIKELKLDGNLIIDAISNLQSLADKFFKHNNQLNVFIVNSDSMDEALEIFVRLNHSGQPLSKADLIFSTIVSEKAEFRSCVENIVKERNSTYDMRIDKEFVLRCCLATITENCVNKIEAFKGKVNDIYNNWEEIDAAITTVCKFARENGFSSGRLSSYNALVPVVYYVYKTKSNLVDEKESIKKYLVISMLKTVYAANVDWILNTMITKLKEEGISKRFDYDTWLKLIPTAKNIDFRLDKAELEHIIDNYSYGNQTLWLLYLLYPNVDLKNNIFHQDHMHPKNLLDRKSKVKKNISEDENVIDFVLSNFNKLPNLQLLDNIENSVDKSGNSLSEYIGVDQSRKQYLIEHSYCKNIESFETKDFVNFYKIRKSNIINKFCEMLDIKI